MSTTDAYQVMFFKSPFNFDHGQTVIWEPQENSSARHFTWFSCCGQLNVKAIHDFHEMANSSSIGERQNFLFQLSLRLVIVRYEWFWKFKLFGKKTSVSESFNDYNKLLKKHFSWIVSNSHVVCFIAVVTSSWLTSMYVLEIFIVG